MRGCGQWATDSMMILNEVMNFQIQFLNGISHYINGSDTVKPKSKSQFQVPEDPKS